MAGKTFEPPAKKGVKAQTNSVANDRYGAEGMTSKRAQTEIAQMSKVNPIAWANGLVKKQGKEAAKRIIEQYTGDATPEKAFYRTALQQVNQL